MRQIHLVINVTLGVRLLGTERMVGISDALATVWVIYKRPLFSSFLVICLIWSGLPVATIADRIYLLGNWRYWVLKVNSKQRIFTHDQAVSASWHKVELFAILSTLQDGLYAG